MTTYNEVPTAAGRPFTERLQLPDGNIYSFKFYWNHRSSCWNFDLLDATAQFKLLSGVPLVTGCDLLEQFLYVPFAVNTLWTVMTIGPGASPDTVPTFNNLGIDGHLYLTSTP